MSWNYRVWMKIHGKGELWESTRLEVRETYYNADGEITACDGFPREVDCEDMEDLVDMLSKMQKALKLPVLAEEGFKFAENKPNIEYLDGEPECSTIEP